ncbi:VOC family protein [Sphingosinicella rhizophila]|uniref:VOC family protein n=1 Tax=Sphingosinicella rhizophila TaxID=3050082 RepID=A0ABU3QB55_9SPHN|nr:VOC family protein [Sphingosinicella sp. GR2756]MDT9600621.1 VOC family protein [Sphingosinicella sp. GR2756]
MAEQSPVPSGITCYLHPKNGRAGEALDFYVRAFAAEEVARNMAEDGKRIMWAHLHINGGSVMMSDEFPEYSQSAVRDMGGFTIHLQVDDADAWYERAVAAGCEIKMKLENQFWGDRYGSVRDPFGVDWSIGGPVKE